MTLGGEGGKRYLKGRGGVEKKINKGVGDRGYKNKAT
jgi:hypothetical protein